MRAAVYLRVSTDKQDVRNSVARQLAACRTWAAAHGGEILEDHVYRDEAISGSSMARPGLQRILRLLRGKAAPPFDALLVDDSSRLDRGGNLAQLVRIFADRDVQLIAVDSGRDLTAEDEELLVHVKAGLDSHYLREIARRTRAGLAQRALRGLWTGGRVFGYALVKTDDGTRVEIDRAQAKIVREIFRRRVDGAGYREIAIALNGRDVPSPRGGSWDATCIRAILKNGKYRGDWRWNVRQWKKRPESSLTDPGRALRRPKLRPVSEHVESMREDLRIVDDPLWSAAAQTIRTGKVPRPPLRSPLAGLARCSCGGPIARGGGPGRLCCGWARNRGPKVCANRRTVAEADVLKSVTDYLAAEILEPGLVRRATARIVRKLARPTRSSADDVHTSALRRVATLEGQIGRLVAAIADGTDSPAVRSGLADKELQLDRARQAVAAIKLGPGAVIPADPASVRKRLDAVLAGLASSPAAVREALRAVVAEIVVRDTQAGWRMQVRTRPWVLGAKDDPYPTLGSGGEFSRVGYRVDSILARSVGRGRTRTA